jgi:hypothetical protein
LNQLTEPLSFDQGVIPLWEAEISQVRGDSRFSWSRKRQMLKLVTVTCFTRMKFEFERCAVKKRVTEWKRDF